MSLRLLIFVLLTFYIQEISAKSQNIFYFSKSPFAKPAAVFTFVAIDRDIYNLSLDSLNSEIQSLRESQQRKFKDDPLKLQYELTESKYHLFSHPSWDQDPGNSINLLVLPSYLNSSMNLSRYGLRTSQPLSVSIVNKVTGESFKPLSSRRFTMNSADCYYVESVYLQSNKFSKLRPTYLSTAAIYQFPKKAFNENCKIRLEVYDYDEDLELAVPLLK